MKTTDVGIVESDGQRRLFPSESLRLAGEAVVAEHMTAEMAGDLDRTLATFADVPEYDIVPPRGLRRGVPAVRELLGHLLGAFPVLVLEVVRLRHCSDAVSIEGIMRGTHSGTSAGIPASGQSRDLRAAVFFHFDGDRLTRETVYYDELTLLVQRGAHDPAAPSGQYVDRTLRSSSPAAYRRS